MPKKTSDINLGEYLKCFFIGEHGMGKTRALASFPGPIYVADFDHRIKVAKLAFPDRNDIEYDQWDSRSYSRFFSLWKGLAKNCPYATICLDSLTFLSDSILEYSMAREKTPKEQAEIDRHGVIQLPVLSDWNAEMRGLSWILTMGKRINAHLVMTGHLMSTSYPQLDKAASPIVYREIVAGSKKVQSKMPAFFDEVWYFGRSGGFQGGTDYMTWFKPTLDIDAKTSLPLPENINWTDKPFFPMVQELLNAQGIEIANKPGPQANLDDFQVEVEDTAAKLQHP